MFPIKSEALCAICKKKSSVLICINDIWQCDGGCEHQAIITSQRLSMQNGGFVDNTRIKDTLVDAGNAMESMPAERVYNHIESCIPPIDDDFPESESESESESTVPPVNLDNVRLEKEMPGFKSMMELLQRQRDPELIKHEIRRTASEIFAMHYNDITPMEPTEVDMDMIWHAARKFWDRKPKDL